MVRDALVPVVEGVFNWRREVVVVRTVSGEVPAGWSVMEERVSAPVEETENTVHAILSVFSGRVIVMEVNVTVSERTLNMTVALLINERVFVVVVPLGLTVTVFVVLPVKVVVASSAGWSELTRMISESVELESATPSNPYLIVLHGRASQPHLLESIP